jgi:hypothetical protein
MSVFRKVKFTGDTERSRCVAQIKNKKVTNYLPRPLGRGLIEEKLKWALAQNIK